jgi:hypothetical protein
MSAQLTGATLNTPDRLLLGAGVLYKDFVDYAGWGTCLGATRGGFDWDPGITFRERVYDGVMGRLEGTRVLTGCAPKLTVRVAEVTVNNILYALGGAASAGAGALTRIESDWLGLGTGVLATFDTHADVVAGSYTVYVEAAAPGSVPVLQVEGGANDYTIVTATGVITFNAGSIPAVGDNVMASYTYDAGGPATHYVITPRQYIAADYLSNIALIVPYTGVTTATRNWVVVLHKAVSDGSWKLSTRDNEDGLVEFTFEGFFPKASPTHMPFDIWHPIP